jgi:hypothetical protein
MLAMNHKYIYTILTTVALGLVLFLVNGAEKVTTPAENIGTTTPVSATTSVEWVTSQNTKYKYSVKRPSTSEISLMGSDSPVTETEKIAIVQAGRPVGYLSIYVIESTFDTKDASKQENQRAIDTLLRKTYNSNLDTFIQQFQEELLRDEGEEIKKMMSEVTNVNLAGKEGKEFTFAVTYVGDDNLDYPLTGKPDPYLFFKHNGVTLVLSYNLEDDLAKQILSTFRFE